MASLAPAEIHVVLTARDIARQVPAEWQERLKHQGRMRYGKFVRRVQKPRSAMGRSFWQVQGVTQVLERWSRQLPPDRVHVVTVPQPGAPHGELWRRFCRAVDVDPAWAPARQRAPQPLASASPRARCCASSTTGCARPGSSTPTTAPWCGDLIVHETLATEPVQQRLTLPPDLYDWAEEVAELVAGVDRRVRGRRRRRRRRTCARCARRPTRSGTTPTGPGPAHVADAALDALVAMIEEAARRRGPRRAR